VMNNYVLQMILLFVYNFVYITHLKSCTDSHFLLPKINLIDMVIVVRTQNRCRMLWLRKQMNEFVRMWTGAGSILIVCLKTQRMIYISRCHGCLHCSCMTFLNKLLQLYLQYFYLLSNSFYYHYHRLYNAVTVITVIISQLLFYLLLVWVDN
jgi:hypothetical protein